MTVRVRINVHNFELSERLEEYVSKKVSKLDRYLNSIEDATVDLTFNKSARSAGDRQVAQLTLKGRGVLLRAEDRTDDIFNSVDKVMDKIFRQIERFKGKHRKSRGDGRNLKDLLPAPIEYSEEDEPVLHIARRKQFMLSPMNEEEAMDQMLLLGHENFFIFLNADTSRVNVLYYRRDGTLGLIEPEVA